jgi:hypothetical protein
MGKRAVPAVRARLLGVAVLALASTLPCVAQGADPLVVRGYDPSRPQTRFKRQAPPLPFRYVGRMVNGGKTVLLLSRGDQTFIAEVGQKFGGPEGEWRLDGVTEHEIVFTYLPLAAKKFIPL